jgi:hypothetical protein
VHDIRAQPNFAIACTPSNVATRRAVTLHHKVYFQTPRTQALLAGDIRRAGRIGAKERRVHAGLQPGDQDSCSRPNLIGELSMGWQAGTWWQATGANFSGEFVHRLFVSSSGHAEMYP